MTHESLLAALCIACTSTAYAQSAIHPQHFDLHEVTLLDCRFNTSRLLNIRVLLDYDYKRLMTPFVRESGLDADTTSPYYQWTVRHPKFPSWNQFDGHAGGHYLSALALAYASCHDEPERLALKARLDTCIAIVDDCQKAYDNDQRGMKGFVGGQEMNDVWMELYQGKTDSWQRIAYKVPFYCTHKVLAGLRDAWLYAGSKTALRCFRKLADWHIALISHLDETTLQRLLDTEHGGVAETMADAYTLFRDKKYLDAAKRYAHRSMIDGLQTLDRDFLNGMHANTQIPKFTAFDRIWREDATQDDYRRAALNFWTDVAENRTLAIGGNSTSEHFQPHDKGAQVIMDLDGTESCNSYNMLRLDETLFDDTHEAKYADAYEQTMMNHILATQDPTTGGYQYLTAMRPESYRTYSTVNSSMWCCVGTGMENHSRYGHFVYTHSATNDTLYVNLFTPSRLDSRRFALTQTTNYPYTPSTTLTIRRSGRFALAIRRPSWTTDAYRVTLNGQPVSTTIVNGYAILYRKFRKGDVVEVDIPMTLRVEPCPDYPQYVAFKYGPVLLAGKTTTNSASEAERTGLPLEQLPGEYGRDGGSDHMPSVMMRQKALASSPIIVGRRDTLLRSIRPVDPSRLEFELTPTNRDLSPELFARRSSVLLMPYTDVAHARYIIYWYQPTAEEFRQTDLFVRDKELSVLNARTIDFVATGEQQSELIHEALHDASSRTAMQHGERFRDCQQGGFIQYTLFIPEADRRLVEAGKPLSLMLRLAHADAQRLASVFLNGHKLDMSRIQEASADNTLPLYDVELPLTGSMLTTGNGTVPPQVVFRMEASKDTPSPAIYGIRLMRGK